MGLLDLLKKRKKSLKKSIDIVTSNGPPNVFKGDLAKIQNKDRKKIIPMIENQDIPKMPPNYLENKDSQEAVIFMTFDEKTTTCWLCPNCETSNNNSYNSCIVCGYGKDR